MSRIVAQFDPSAQSGSFSAAAVNRCSALLFMNESANFLTLDFGGAFPSTILQPWSNRLIRLAQPVQTVNWTVAATLASTDAPVSQVYVEAFDPSENLDGIASGPLFRQTNVGNAVSTSASTPNSLEQDTLTPFVLGFSSLVATKDGTFPNQLDVTGGVALLRQSDQSIGRVAPVATTFATTALSATYFLDLQPDGTWSFGLAHSGQPNYLPIAQVTTDASGNIATVADKRTLNTSLLAALGGAMNLPRWASDSGKIFDDGGGGLTVAGLFISGGPAGSTAHIDYEGSPNFVIFRTGETGAVAQGFIFQTWNGSTATIPLGLGAGSSAFAPTWLSDAGAFAQVAGQASAGSFGVPVIVAQAINQHITSTANQTLASFTPPADGLYVAYASFVFSNGSNSTITMRAAFTDPLLGTGVHALFSTTNGFTNALAFVATPGTTVPAAPITFYAKGGSAITLEFQDTTGTPSDHVTMQLMRLS